MKKLFFGLLCCFLSIALFSACGEDDVIGDVNTVTWEVTASDDYARILINYSSERNVRINSGKKVSYKTDHYSADCTVKCEDEYTVLTVKGYVNGKLKVEKEGKKWMSVTMKVK